MNFRKFSIVVAFLIAATINVSCEKDDIIQDENVTQEESDIQSVKKSEIEEDDT